MRRSWLAIITPRSGFATPSYDAIRDGDGLATVTVCEDQVGTRESSRPAAEWVGQNFTGGSIGGPEITEGEAFIQFSR